MGDLVGVAVSGALNYVPHKEFERIRTLPVDAVKKTELFASLCRINTLYMIACAGSGHIGSSFSSMDIMCWLQLNELRTAAPNDLMSPNDVFFSSKGHDAPGLYNTWIGLGKLDFDLIHQLRRINGLPGHPDVSTPNVVTNTGSLGMGVSKAKGMIFANRLQKKTGNVFVLTGDGELQEGQFWESLISAANHKLHELIVIVDHNKLQSDTLVSRVSDLGDLEAKLTAFGWHVSRCDGNNVETLSKTLAAIKTVADKPKIIIADTIKGKGVSFMEHTSIDSDIEFYKFHSGAPTDDAYVRAAKELIDAANAMLATFQARKLELETVIRPVAMQPENLQRLIQAYSKALLEEARKNPKIVALDADLILDTGLIPFQKEFPERFLECGIAEQDMVSQAGGMALHAVLPIVHSFSCFLSSRPNEQIYNNATEQTKIIYVGSLAGVIPAGPGHSHQAVRDISLLAAIPNLTIVEPSCEEEVGLLLDWCINLNEGSSYIRLVSVPCEIPYELPASYSPVVGKGVVLKKGVDICLIAYGPLMLSNAFKAALAIEGACGKSVCVINMPWLNVSDGNWLADSLSGFDVVVCIENQYLNNGMADSMAELILEKKIKIDKFRKLGLRGLPKSGTNDEVLRYHSLDVNSIADFVLEIVDK